ncbi:816_t:CDS:10, partial [Gigaspora rosea]
DEQIKINWMKYESMVGCDDLIRDYWLRERSINPLASPSGSSRILVGSGWYKFRYESDCDQPNNSMDFIDDFTQTNVTLTNMMRDVENVLSNEMSTENVETTLPNTNISANNLNDAGLKPNTINKLDSLSKEVNNLDNEIIEQSIKPNKKSKFTNDELEQNNFSSINNSASINDKVNNSASINKVNNNSSSTDKVNNNSISTDKVNNNNSVSTEKANNNNNSLSIAIDNDDLSEKTRGKTISINISTKDHASGFIPKIFSATHTQIYKEQELISSKKSLDAQLTDIGVTKNTGINDAQHQANMEWKGSLIKEHCIRLSDAMKIVTPNALGFITEPANILKSKYNMRKEYMFMKENNIVGVIWLNKDKQRCLLAFAISNEICRFLQLRHKPNVPLILLEKTLLSQPSSSETSKYQKLFPRQMLDNNLDLQICEIYLNYMEYFRLLEICKNPGVKILLFVPDPKQVTVEGGQVIMKENLEVVEMEHALNCLGAVCVNTYSDDIQYVLIHYLFEKQIYWIPNLIKLKRLPNCKFVGFGTNPNNIKFWNLDEFFKQGGFVTATAPLFVKGENVVFRILTVMNHQKQLYKDASWEFLLSKNVLDALDRCCRLRSINSHNARLAYYSLIAKINMKKIRYFNPDEIFKYNN